MTEPERHGRKSKTTIQMDGKTDKIAKSQPIISSRVIKEDLVTCEYFNN